MVLTMQSLYPLLVFILAVLPIIPAQTCDALSCETSFSLFGPASDISCFVDPNDPSNFATTFAICPCDSGTDVEGSLVYTGLNNAVTTASAANTQYLSPQYSYDTLLQTYNVPLTQIKPDTPVTIRYSILQQSVLGLTYTQRQSQSIFYTGVIGTFVSTINTQKTTTQTATEVDVTQLPASTFTSPCTTGTQTFTAKTSTTTITVTSTPVPRTINKNVISTTSTTLSCIPNPTSHAKQNRSPREEVLQNRQTISIGYEAPRCANTPASYITIVTSTTLSTAFTTVTDTSTTYTTTTISSVTTPPASTLCQNVKGTTTVTPTRTKISTKRLNRSTTTSIHSVIVTKTVVPKHLPNCAPTAALVGAVAAVLSIG